MPVEVYDSRVGKNNGGEGANPEQIFFWKGKDELLRQSQLTTARASGLSAVASGSSTEWVTHSSPGCSHSHYYPVVQVLPIGSLDFYENGEGESETDRRDGERSSPDVQGGAAEPEKRKGSDTVCQLVEGETLVQGTRDL